MHPSVYREEEDDDDGDATMYICIVDANFNRETIPSYLLVNLAKVLMGLDSRNEPFRLNLRLMALFPSDNLSMKDVRRFSPLILTSPTLNHH